jgi:hypothetical protein
MASSNVAHLNPTSQVTLHFKAQGLARSDLFSKSDPYACLIMGSPRPREVGRTEVIKNCHDPIWVKSFIVDYSFEEEQIITVKIAEDDGMTSDDFLGQCSFKLADLVVAPGQQLTLALTAPSGKRAKGTLTVSGEEVAYVHDYVKLSFAATGLPKKDGLFGKSDPFYIIERVREDGSWVRIYQSPVIPKTLNPTWQAAEMSVQSLCNGDHARPLRIVVYDHDSDGSHDYMCEMETSLGAILEKQGTALTLKDVKKGKNRGSLVVKSAEFFRQPTFLDYLAGNMQINMVVAIDFTGSNGNPATPGTLHYIDPRRSTLNEYQQAILSIGSILQAYDSDKKFPVYGFGGKVVPGGPVQHCFPICPQSAIASGGEVDGVQGIMDAYAAAIQTVGLSGPTLFTEVIQAAARKASQHMSQATQHYTVLLILTDGVINDMQSTVDAIVHASSLPLSIIIVGVGSADFSSMCALDGDGQILTDSQGKKGTRDIVQFVQFSRFKPSPGQSASASSSLAKETLAEVPAQLIAAMKQLNFHPNPPRAPPAQVQVLSPTISSAFAGASAPEGLPSYAEATSTY